MMSSHKIELLRNQIKQFEILKCRMYHEGVKLDESGQPIYKDIDNDRVFERVSLCDHHIRSKRLGCAHSNVNIKFEKLLIDFAKHNSKYSTEILEFKSRFTSIVNKIYHIDHQMGFVERDLAQSEIESNRQQRSRLMHKKQELVQIHDSLMDDLNSLKTEVEMFIERHKQSLN